MSIRIQWRLKRLPWKHSGIWKTVSKKFQQVLTRHLNLSGEKHRCIIYGTGPIWFNDQTGTGGTVLKRTLGPLAQLHSNNYLEVNTETRIVTQQRWTMSGLQGYLIKQGCITVDVRTPKYNRLYAAGQKPFALGLSSWNTGFGFVLANNHVFLFLHTVD